MTDDAVHVDYLSGDVVLSHDPHRFARTNARRHHVNVEDFTPILGGSVFGRRGKKIKKLNDEGLARKYPPVKFVGLVKPALLMRTCTGPRLSRIQRKARRMSSSLLISQRNAYNLPGRSDNRFDNSSIRSIRRDNPTT